MILRLDDPKLMSDAIGVVSEIVSEVRIKLLEDGMSIIAVDPANVALVIFKLPRTSFAEYEVGSDSWGVNLDDLKKILKRAGAAASITFEEVEGKLKITIFDKIKRTFSLSLIEVTAEDKEIPELNFAARVEMASTGFAQAVEDANVVADSCAFAIKDGVFSVEGSGNLNSAKAEFSGSEMEIFGNGRSKYSLEYLMKFIKASKLCGEVVVNFSDDYPLRLDFPGERMGVGFVLAPRVEN